MSEDLISLMKEVGMGVVIGTVIGVLLRRRLDWCRSWTRFVLDGQWKLFAFGAVLFGSGAIGFWWAEMNAHAIASGLMCILELFAMFRYGFTRLTPEMESQIDASIGCFISRSL